MNQGRIGLLRLACAALAVGLAAGAIGSDLLRRRLHLVRKRGQLLAHLQNLRLG